MKRLYVIILFLIFFNIFTFMLPTLQIFPFIEGFPTGYAAYNLTDTENASAQEIAEKSSGYDFNDVISLLIGDISSIAEIIATIGILGGALALAYITHSPTPLIIGVVANIMKNIYLNNLEVFESIPEINEYLMLASLVGMIILFILTCMEILSHGHGEV